MVNVNDLSIKSLETLMTFGVNGGSFRFELDELQNTTLANTEEKTNQTGRNGRTIGTLKKNKAVTVSGTSGMVSLGLMEAQVGSTAESKETTVKYPDYVTALSETTGEGENAVTTVYALSSYVAVGTVGNEIGVIHVKNNNGIVIKTLKQDATASATGKFAYNPESKKITFYAGDVKEGDNLTFYYKRKIQADAVITNYSDNFSETLEVYVDFIAEDKCKNEYHGQIFMPYADFSGNFDLALGGDQTTHAFEATSIASACGNKKSKLWDITIFGANVEDVA